MDRDYGQSLKKATNVLKTSRMRKQEFFAEMGMLLLRSTDLDVFFKAYEMFFAAIISGGIRNASGENWW